MPALNDSKRLNHETVLKHFQSRKRVLTTMQIAEHFGVSKMQAAAAIAILVLRKLAKRADPPKTQDGISRWVLT